MAGRTGEPTANPRQVTPQSAANPAEMGSRPTVDFLDPAGGRGRRGPWPRRASRQAELPQPIHCRPWRTLTWIMDTPACAGERHASRHAATPPRADRSGDQGRSCPPGVGQHDELAHDGARRVEPADLRTGPEADDRTLTRERHRLACGSPSRPPGRRPGGVTLGFSDRVRRRTVLATFGGVPSARSWRYVRRGPGPTDRRQGPASQSSRRDRDRPP